MEKRILVTGGNGFIGSQTVLELSRRGYLLRLLLRKQSNTERIRGASYETVLGDIRNAASVIKAAQGCYAIIHMASVSSWSQIRAAQESKELHSIIVDGTRNVLEAAKIGHVSRVVYVSSAAAINASTRVEVFNESTPFSLDHTQLAYGIAKHEAEKVVLGYVKNDGLDALIVNPCETYGPNDLDGVTSGNLISILEQSPAVVCAGGTSVAHVDDIARGICLALERGRKGERYILGGENLTIRQLTVMVRQLGKKRGPVISLPNAWVLAAAKLLARLGLKSPIPLDVLEYAMLYWFVDSSKARRELGFEPRPAREIFEEIVPQLSDVKKAA